MFACSQLELMPLMSLAEISRGEEPVKVAHFGSVSYVIRYETPRIVCIRLSHNSFLVDKRHFMLASVRQST